MANFKIIKKSAIFQARTGKLETAHGKITTPVFMPVGTLGTVKGVNPEELRKLGAEIILGNTYHLYLRPGEKLIKRFEGLHQFMRWKGPILTDSGGFQVFSLGKNFKISNDKFPMSNQIQNPNVKCQNNYEFRETLKPASRQGGQVQYDNCKSLVKITEKGVEFRSHLDGSKHFFTPEKVIDIQLALGSDIIMVLDVCTEYPATYKRAKETMEITHLWAKRSMTHFQKKMREFQMSNFQYQIKSKCQMLNVKTNSESLIANRPLIFGIVQGSTYKDLRIESAKYISSLGFDGIAVGGVSVGEGKNNMEKVMKWVSPYLPENLPHYLMGIGEPEDIVKAIKYGFDMFDCVLPTRLARHGVVWINSKSQTLNPKPFDIALLESERPRSRRQGRQIQNSKLKFQKIDLRKAKYREDKNIIEKNCGCYACQNKFSRGYISHLIREHEMLGFRLSSIHNLHFLINLVKKIRDEIKQAKF